ncbi:MAG: response regulator transcription factor [Deltaproteobacteria bacterium]|nr:response regulator transcription factor [Deltaproteobacteria bacterium]
MPHTVLIADDDPHIREVARFALEKAGLRAISAEDGAEAISLFTREKPSLVILDVMMPEKDGLEVCREIRKRSSVPILFLSSRSDEIDRVVGLELGGDDYVTKPFSPRELVARVNAILKRASGAALTPKEERLRHGSLTLDTEGRTALWKKTPIELTATEFSLLLTLMQRPGKVFSRDNLMDLVYKNDVHVNDRTIDSHVRHVRAKFEEAGAKDIIETMRGVGYRIGGCE